MGGNIGCMQESFSQIIRPPHTIIYFTEVLPDPPYALPNIEPITAHCVPDVVVPPATSFISSGHAQYYETTGPI